MKKTAIALCAIFSLSGLAAFAQADGAAKPETANHTMEQTHENTANVQKKEKHMDKKADQKDQKDSQESEAGQHQ